MHLAGTDPIRFLAFLCSSQVKLALARCSMGGIESIGERVDLCKNGRSRTPLREDMATHNTIDRRVVPSGSTDSERSLGLSQGLSWRQPRLAAVRVRLGGKPKRLVPASVPGADEPLVSVRDAGVPGLVVASRIRARVLLEAEVPGAPLRHRSWCAGDLLFSRSNVVR